MCHTTAPLTHTQKRPKATRGGGLPGLLPQEISHTSISIIFTTILLYKLRYGEVLASMFLFFKKVMRL